MTPAVNAAQDPTKPPTWLSPELSSDVSSNKLESILLNGNKRLAVIGGQTYREGERFGQQRIRRIHKNLVELDNGDTLSLYPQIIKRSR